MSIVRCGRCTLCLLAAKHPAYAAVVAASEHPCVGAVSLPAKAGAEPCRFRGESLSGFERNARGLDHIRHWTFCLHVEKPLGEAVCHCRGCGPDCPGYTPDA